ncbi:MAG: hypothetical protein PHE49_11575 [bacterium]|nr:hypothetical protein [bacterium]
MLMLSLVFILNNVSISPLKLVAERCYPEPDSFMFKVQWENPSCPDSIIKAFYKIGPAPISNDDTTGSLSGSPDTIYIQQGRDGQRIFVWFLDNKGNIDYRSSATTELETRLTNIHLFNILTKENFYFKINFGVGFVSRTGFTTLDSSFTYSVVEKFGIETGIEKGFTELSFRFNVLGSSPDMPSGNLNFDLLNGDITISRKQELISNFLGVEPFLGWGWLQKNGSLWAKNNSTEKEEEVFNETQRDNGALVGVNLAKYIIPNIVMSESGTSFIGMKMKYSYLFFMGGINEFGIEFIFFSRFSKKGFYLVTLGLNGYAGKDPNTLYILWLDLLNGTVYF